MPYALHLVFGSAVASIAAITAFAPAHAHGAGGDAAEAPSVAAGIEARPDLFAEPPRLEAPIGGVTNDFWFDYKTDIAEAEHELAKDLARATDREDVLDAREEYDRELADALKDYTKEMRERGYVQGRVTIGEQ